jgi:hypothetical protein
LQKEKECFMRRRMEIEKQFIEEYLNKEEINRLLGRVNLLERSGHKIY